MGEQDRYRERKRERVVRAEEKEGVSNRESEHLGGRRGGGMGG